MHPRICINGMSTREWPLDRELAYYAATGAHSATVCFAKLAGDVPAGVDAILKSSVRPALLGGGTATPLLGGLDVVKAPIDAARAMGCPTFYSISGGTPDHMSTDEAYPLLVEALRPITEYARSQGVRIAIENNSVATRAHGFLHTLADCADLAAEADIDICLELQNCWYERNLPRLFRETVDRLVMIQVSDFLIGEELRFNRRVPGDGSIPLDWMIGKLLDAGYEGLFDIEVLGPAIEAEGYAPAIERSVEWLSARLTGWGV